MKLLAIACALLALPLAASLAGATHSPLFYERHHAWYGTYTPGHYTPTDSFYVWGGLLCYERTSYAGFDQASSFRVTVRDGADDLLVVDAGATVDVGPVVSTPIVPLSAGAYTPGRFTVEFQGEGYAGEYTIRLYAVGTLAECGRYAH